MVYSFFVSRTSLPFFALFAFLSILKDVLFENADAGTIQAGCLAMHETHFLNKN